MRRKLGCIIPAIILFFIISYIIAVVLIRMYSPQNKKYRIEDASTRLRVQIEDQAGIVYGDEWQETVSIKEITVQETPWYVIDPNEMTFTVTFNGTEEEKTYVCGNYYQRTASGLAYCEISDGRQGNINLSLEEFPLAPFSLKDRYIFGLVWDGNRTITLSDDQQLALIGLFGKYSAVTTDEIAFSAPASSEYRFNIQFFDEEFHSVRCSVGICIGRDGTEECYAVSNYSNTRYARVINGTELYKEVCGLLETWGIRQNGTGK